MTGSVCQIMKLSEHFLFGSDALLIDLFHFLLNLFFHIFLVVLSHQVSTMKACTVFLIHCLKRALLIGLCLEFF